MKRFLLIFLFLMPITCMGNDTPAYTTAKSQLETLFQQAKAAIEKIKTTTNTESQVIQENTIADNNGFDSEQACKDTITKSGRNGLECYKESDKWKLRWTFKVGDECPKTDCSVNAEVTKCEYERVTATSFSCKVTECKTGYTVVDGVCKENQSQNNANSERNNCTKDQKFLTQKWDEEKGECVPLSAEEQKDICEKLVKNTHKWENNKCVERSKEEQCKLRGAEWRDGACYTPKDTKKARQECTDDQKFLTQKWDEAKGKCVPLSAEEQKDICEKLVKNTHKWEDGKCVERSKEEQCKLRGAEWRDGACYTPKDTETSTDTNIDRDECLGNPTNYEWDEIANKCRIKTDAEKEEEKAQKECWQKPLTHKWDYDKKECIELKTPEEKQATQDKFKENAKKCPEDKPYYRVGPNGGECVENFDDEEEEEEIKVYTAEETDKIINDINKKYREKPLEKVEAPKPESLTRPGTTANSNPVDMDNLQLARKQGDPCASNDPNSTGAGTWETNGGFCLPKCKNGFANLGRNGACLKEKK